MSVFDELDEALPLVLLPVRLVTRFHRPRGPRAAPTHLHVRIHPDVIHADGHDPALTEHELVLGKGFWARVQAAGDDEAAIADARSWLAAQLDPYRALWVAGQMAPNRPSPPQRKLPRATLARLLPQRWLAIGYVNNEEVGRWWSGPVAADLPMAPNLAELEKGQGVRALLSRQGLGWMTDFGAALEAGMAISIPLDAQTRKGFGELIVVGATGRTGDVEGLADLLSAHRYTHGIDLVPQGSPTNNTDAAASAVSVDAPDLAPLFESELEFTPPRERPSLDAPGTLYRTRAAGAASIALGLQEANALDRAANAGLAETERAHATNQALWPGTAVYTLESPLGFDGSSAVRGDDLEWLRDWFCDYVRGGALLPVVRVGEQPYGLLPVTGMPFGAASWQPATRREWLEKTVADLFDMWMGSLDTAPTLSPVSGATAPSGEAGEEAVTVASVLGAMPHPGRLRLRAAPDEFLQLADEWSTKLNDFATSLDAVPEPDGEFVRDKYAEQEFTLVGGDGVLAQITALGRLRADYENQSHTWSGSEATNPYHPLIADIDDVLMPLLEAHDDRAKLRRIVSGFPRMAPLANFEDPRLWYVLYDDPGDEQAPTLRIVDPSRSRLVTELEELAADALITGPRRAERQVPIPLLRRLIERSVVVTQDEFRPTLSAAILRLAEIADIEETGDPIGELERLTRETLGLLTHRLDAWHASVAAERLAQKRKLTPDGVQVGAYGWVVNLAPDDGGPDTQGFIHAPSLAHAATAAVLRSAWSAFSTDAGAAAFAVDLSSERVRRAEWILEGVRNGQELGALVGARFERRLHDGLLDRHIEDVRSAVLTGQGSSDPPTAIVDGLALAVAYADTPEPTEEDPVRTAVDAVLAASGGDKRGLRDALADTAVDLDAVSDALVAQTVHSVLAGDLSEAAAAAAAMGSGDTGVPELRYPHVHRESDLVTHRVAALFGDEQPDAASLTGTIEPALGAWAERLLGAGLVGAPCRATFLDAAGRPLGTADFDLGDPGLGALELIALAPLGDPAEGGRLARALGAWARRFRAGSIEPASVARVEVDLPDVMTALGPLRQAIGRARPLGSQDLATAETEAAPDVGELEGRLEPVADRLREIAGDEGHPDAVLKARLADLVALNPAATIAALEADDPAARKRAVQGLTERALAAAEALGARRPDGWDTLGPTAQADHVAGRLAAAIGLSLPVLPRFTAPDPTGLNAAFEAGPDRAGDALAIPAWLLQVGRVHAAAGLLYEGLGLLELVAGEERGSYGLAQLPSLPGEPWAAVARPPAGRTCIVSVTDWRGPLAASGMSGLLFDGWVEAVPRPEVMTGVAVHFDSPSARPPQAVLLMTVPPEPGFTEDEVVRILDQTLSMARARAIGTETLGELGHYLPGVFLPEGSLVTEESAT